MTVVFLGSLAVTGAVGLVIWSVFGGSRPAEMARSNLTAGFDDRADLRTLHLQNSAVGRLGGPAMRWLAGRGRRLTPAGWIEALETKIHLGGVGARWPVERVLAAKVVLGGAFVAIGAWVFLSGPSFGRLLLWCGLGAGGFLAPDALLHSRAKERQERIRRELPDILDQVTISVEAGLGFEAALHRTVLSTTGPLSDELAYSLQDIQIGVPRREAFAGLLERTDVEDLRHFVLALGQAEKLGLPIGKIMRVQASELREKRRQAAEEHAHKVPVKIILPLVVCVFPVLFIVMVGPAAIRIANAGLGG